MKCPGQVFSGTRDIFFNFGTVPDNPGHVVTLWSSEVRIKKSLVGGWATYELV